MPVLSQTPWGLSHRARRCGGADSGQPCQEGSTDPTDLLRGREAPEKPPGRVGAFSKCHMSRSTRKGQEWRVGASSLCKHPEMPSQVCKSRMNCQGPGKKWPPSDKLPREALPALMNEQVSRAGGSPGFWAQDSLRVPAFPPPAGQGWTFLQDPGPRPAPSHTVSLAMHCPQDFSVAGTTG